MLIVLERPSEYHQETKDTNYDNLWKKVIMDLFEDFLYFFLPSFHKEWLKQGIEQGIEQQKMATARNLIVLAMDDELIVKVTGLSVEQVEILRSEM